MLRKENQYQNYKNTLCKTQNKHQEQTAQEKEPASEPQTTHCKRKKNQHQNHQEHCLGHLHLIKGLSVGK